LKFCANNYINLELWHTLSNDDKDLIFACYASDLIAGKTLKSMSIAVGTVNLYLIAAGAKTFNNNFHNYSPSGFVQASQNSFSPLTLAVLKEYNRWMKVPNRREPLTKEMLKYFISTYKNAHQDSKEAALLDWMILGAKTGFRKSEWCQDFCDIKKGIFNRNIDGTLKAFIPSDWEFKTILSGKNEVHKNCKPNVVYITWRFQKNGANGETIPFEEDAGNPDFCPVAAATRIFNRATRLNKNNKNGLLAVFAHGDKETKYLHNNHVREFLREAAVMVYGIKKESHLKLFTCHSICVGACVALHVGGATEMDIKSRLRWRSNSFLMYLRHMVQLGHMHNMAYNRSEQLLLIVNHQTYFCDIFWFRNHVGVVKFLIIFSDILNMNLF